MSVRAFDFTSSAYAKTKSFKAKENVTSASKIKEKRNSENHLPGVKSSWTPLKQDLNEKVIDLPCYCLISCCENFNDHEVSFCICSYLMRGRNLSATG